MQEAINRLIDNVLKSIGPVDWVALRESWTIVVCTNGKPTMEKTRYFCFFNRGREYEDGRVDITVLDHAAENAVEQYIQDKLHLKRFSPGAADSPSLIGVWA